jgi:pimeloyl-ACP methyl ester carboxylesterase
MTGRRPRIHGMAGSSETWASVLPRLAPNYRVIAPDLIGHGNSDKPRTDYSLAAFAAGLRDLLDELGIRRATIVGHSLGGGVAMQLMYQHPECCERLILISSGGLGRAGEHHDDPLSGSNQSPPLDALRTWDV